MIDSSRLRLDRGVRAIDMADKRISKPLLPRSHVGVDPPWLLLAWPGSRVVRIDAGFLDRIVVSDSDLHLSVDDVSVAIHIADGFESAVELADQLAPYTRWAPITAMDVYEDAKRRLQLFATEGGSHVPLTVGTETVSVQGAYVYVGEVVFRLSDVTEYAARAGNLPMPDGGLLQAAFVHLVITAAQRPVDEDAALLRRRIAEFEASPMP
jgi:hypothetical protein